MAGCYVTMRLTQSGPRYVVRYRFYGRGAKLIHGGSFLSRTEAEQIRDEIAYALAAGRGFRRPESKLRSRKRELVYFAQLGPLVKIGVSVDPEQRVKSLSGSSLLHVEEGGRVREAELHRKFADYRESGEWFFLKGRIKSYLRVEARKRAMDEEAA